MCNLIEGCFSVLKAKIKAYLSLAREDLIVVHRRGEIAAARMLILECAAERSVGSIDLRLVNKMALHRQQCCHRC
ncbi:hypothetical protein PI124_g12240 [Phytophthora idaei]|nr:hypothetical protein PI126_g11288 [Phytophthora idaei]KAG3242924.1 hypothetical protein PI124_g12240 [Phytophthora idaei]